MFRIGSNKSGLKKKIFQRWDSMILDSKLYSIIINRLANNDRVFSSITTKQRNFRLGKYKFKH